MGTDVSILSVTPCVDKVIDDATRSTVPGSAVTGYSLGAIGIWDPAM